MKLLLLLLFIVGCNQDGTKEHGGDLVIMRDEKQKVTCYSKYVYDGIFCLRDEKEK